MTMFISINLGFIWLTIIFNFLLIVAVIRRVDRALKPDIQIDANTWLENMLQPGTSLPPFTAETLDGQTIQQDDLSGKKILMIFTSPTCIPCKVKMPEFQKLYPIALKHGTEIMMISIGERQHVKDFFEEMLFSGRVLQINFHDAMYSDYKIQATPSYYLVDGVQNIEARGLFRDDWEELKKKWQ